MMRKISILIIIIVGLFSCRKNKDTQIIIGNDYRMKIKKYNVNLQGDYGNSNIFELDINEDKINDFKMISVIGGSVGLGHHPYPQIICETSNSSLFGEIIQDSTYYHYTKNLYMTSTHALLDIEYYFSCSRQTNNDIVTKVLSNQFKILSLNTNDFLSKDDIFKTDTFLLTDGNFIYGNPQVLENDTLRNRTYYYSSCYAFPQNQICYIGIKIKEQKRDRIGWIKLQVIDEYKIQIIETAIQR